MSQDSPIQAAGNLIEDLPQFSATSPAAKAWQIGLSLGVVSTISKWMRFDPTLKSLWSFRRHIEVLQRHIGLLTDEIGHRDTGLSRVNIYQHEIEDTYSTLEHCELLNSYLDGSDPASDLWILTPAPPGLTAFLENVESMIPAESVTSFGAGLAAGESWARAHYQQLAVLLIPLPQMRLFNLTTHEDNPNPTSPLGVSETQQRILQLADELGWQRGGWNIALGSSDGSHGPGGDLDALRRIFAWIAEEFRTPPADVIPELEQAGFLDIILGNNRTARRREQAVEFGRRALPWEIFRLLVERADQFTTEEQLRICWERADGVGSGDPDRATVYQNITSLRDLIGSLDLRIENRPRAGWRIRNHQV